MDEGNAELGADESEVLRAVGGGVVDVESFGDPAAQDGLLENGQEGSSGRLSSILCLSDFVPSRSYPGAQPEIGRDAPFNARRVRPERIVTPHFRGRGRGLVLSRFYYRRDILEDSEPPSLSKKCELPAS
jgi:hypothetical protein